VAACSGNYETGGRPVLFKDFQSDVSSTAQRHLKITQHMGSEATKC
jgi:hypothetical protein